MVVPDAAGGWEISLLSTGKAIPLISLLNVVVVVSHVQRDSLWHCSLPGSSVHGIFQARILGWVAISSSRGSSWPREPTWVSCIAGWFFIWATRGAPSVWTWTIITQISLCGLNLGKLGLWCAGGPRQCAELPGDWQPHSGCDVLCGDRGRSARRTWSQSAGVPRCRLWELGQRPLCHWASLSPWV